MCAGLGSVHEPFTSTIWNSGRLHALFPRGGDSLTELLPAQKGAPRSSPPAVGVAPLGNASVPGVSVLDSF